ncbi:MAG: SMP-30/gluconolactonase/LRE family protein [Bacteroidota bacterium]
MPPSLRRSLHRFLLPACLSTLSCASTGAPATGGTAAASGATSTATDRFAGAGTANALPADVTFVSLEGPHWVPGSGDGGGYLLFSDVVEANGPGAHIYKFDPVGRRFAVLPYPSAASAGPTSTNGLAVDPSGRLLACERYNARLVRLEPLGGGADAKLTVLAERWPAAEGGQALNAPNDLAVRRDGNVYFTDSDWGTRPGTPHAPMGVYRLSPKGALDRVLDMQKPNGIALSPDGGTLYVGSDVQAKVWKLSVSADGGLGSQTLLIDGERVPGGFKVPDGICIDDTGNLYVTNNADDVRAIVVFDPAGRLLGRIPIPAAPSNCTFGGADRRTLYVTTLHAIYEVQMSTPGLP